MKSQTIVIKNAQTQKNLGNTSETPSLTQTENIHYQDE